MQQFIDKLISEFEKMKKMNYEQYENADCNNDRIACISASNAYGDSVKITKRIAEEYKLKNVDQDFMQDLMVAESLPSLYPMQHFEVEAIDRVIERAKYSGGWISCSDRLPEKNVHVLVTMEDGNMYVAEHISKVMIGTLECRWRTFSAYFASDDIIAWMPLPKPYQKEGE